MIDHATFSGLRASRIFPAEMLGTYQWYIEVDPDGDFDTEYLGGQWHEELIDGVQFFYPASDGKQLGVIELWGSGCVQPAVVRDKPESKSARLVPTWAANANRVLEALELPVRMGSQRGALVKLAAGNVLSSDYPDEFYGSYKDVAKGTLSTCNFACRAPAVYHIQAIVHTTEGLMKLDIRRPDLIRRNDRDGGYDACFGDLFDEG